MTFLCDSKYLVFPTSHHAQNKRVYFYIDDELVYDFVIALDYNEPDNEFYLNVQRFKGMNIRVSIEPEMDLVIKKSNIDIKPEESYIGKYRPLAHFTAKRGWINDPNGLVYYNGKYLMFYQHNPVACTWENMHWGYAISNDLMHWEEKDIALYPDKTGTMFSGSAIIDHKNVTGLKENDNDVILIFYTAAGSTSETAKEKTFTQCLAYSIDGGETFIKYDKNPLINQITGGNRDPKVIYYEPTDSYIMTFYLDNNDFVIYSSKNMLDWQLTQKVVLPGEKECPDFYPLPVDEDENNIKWVFIGASDKYYIGDFDGTTFIPETEVKKLNSGNNSYAAQSWSDNPDGRIIRTSFATVVIPGMPFGSCMSIPQEMTLKTINDDIYLCTKPVKEIETLYVNTEVKENIRININSPLSLKLDGKAYDVSLKAKITDDSIFKFSLFGLNIEYNNETKELKCLDNSAIIELNDNYLELRMIIDTVYTEIFVNEGNTFMGMSYIQDSNLNTLKVETKNNNVYIEKIQLSKLNHFWK